MKYLPSIEHSVFDDSSAKDNARVTSLQNDISYPTRHREGRIHNYVQVHGSNDYKKEIKQMTDTTEKTEEKIIPNESYLKPIIKVSKSGDERTRRNIVKYGEEAIQQRPTTVGTSRERTDVMQPTFDTLESKKYNLKVHSLANSSSNSEENVYRSRASTGLPLVNIRSKNEARKNLVSDFGDNVNDEGDVYMYFNRNKQQKRASTKSPTSLDTPGTYMPSWSDVLVTTGEEFDSNDVEREPWVDTPEPQPLSISDSEDFDTDLETDFAKEPIPDCDVNIGRTVYVQACEKWKTPPQRHVVNSLPKRVLCLRNRSLGSRAIQPICTALKENLRVERLDLEGVDITDDGIQSLAEMLIDNITITHLNVANNSLEMRGAQVLGHVMVVTDSITHLNLSRNKLNENSAWYLTSGIGSNSSITHLDLSYNELGEEAGVLLGAAFARNTKLRHLNMSWNKIRGKGAVSIFRALMLNATLETLNLSWNGMGYDGTVALCKSLKRNPGLTDLDISNNRLNWNCAFLMAEGLRENTTLAKLKIGNNPLTTTGVMNLLESVAAGDSSIILLDCSEIPVLGSADLLAATISRRRTFHFLHGGIVLTHDKIGQRVGRELNPMLRIIEYLRLLGLRPLELLKTFDRSTSFELPRTEFVEQIKKIGVKLHPFEIDALANSISGKGYNKNVINYRKLSMAVREVVEAERARKIREREEWLQIKTYHEDILKKGTIDDFISQSGSARMGGISGTLTDPLDPLKVKSFQTIGMSTSRNSTTVSKPGSDHTIKVPLSMCSPLVLSKASLQPVKKKQKKRRKKDSKTPA